MNKENEIVLQEKLEEKIRKYFLFTSTALNKIELKENLTVKEKTIAKDFLSMAENYFSDAKHFNEKKDLLNALAALSYAHAWLDAGIRAGLFDGKNDDKLFALR